MRDFFFVCQVLTLPADFLASLSKDEDLQKSVTTVSSRRLQGMLPYVMAICTYLEVILRFSMIVMVGK